MKSLGVVRRIDELGRIVLPKEIRRNLGIRDGENLEIFVEDQTIVLKKYSKLKDYNDIIESICELTNNIYNINFIVTDRDKVIYAKNQEQIVSKDLDDVMLSLIHNRESVNNTDLMEIKFGNEKLIGYFNILPIISSIDCLGLIMIYSDIKLKEEYFNILKLLASIIVNKIDIS